MKRFILSGYELLTILIPFLVVFFLLRKRDISKGVSRGFGHLLSLLVFVLYINGVFAVTGTGTLFHMLQFGMDLRPDQINLIPFSEEIFVMGYILNVVLFMPLGFLLPFIWPKTDKLMTILGGGLAFSLLIELSQLFNVRASDVDDLIMNTLGALLGYLVYKLFFSRKRKARPFNYSILEPILYITAMFAGHFFFYNEMGLARILYNF